MGYELLTKYWMKREVAPDPGKVLAFEIIDFEGKMPDGINATHFKGVRNLGPATAVGRTISGDCSTSPRRAAAFINGPRSPVKEGDMGQVLALTGGQVTPAHKPNAVRGDGLPLWPNDYEAQGATIVGIATIRITKTK